MGGNVVETLIGAVVLVVAGLFLAFAYSTAGVGSIGGYPLVAKFDRVDGLAVGGDVRVSGIKVGTITAQSLDPQSYRAVIQFTVEPSVKLPDDSSAKIASQGLLGANYLSIEPGGSDEMLKSGGEIRYTQGSVSLMDLIGHAIFSATGKSAEPPAAGAPGAPALPAKP